ncbi:MAG: hypothetical protein ABIW76_20700 [Fibrobacteria bacterium]
MASDLRAAYLGQLRAGIDSFPPECLEYVFQLVFRASYRGKGFRDLSVTEVFHIFHRQVADDFGSFSSNALDRFGLRTGEDLGRAIFMLARSGCLSLGEGETLAAYAALGPMRFGGDVDA